MAAPGHGHGHGLFNFVVRVYLLHRAVECTRVFQILGQNSVMHMVASCFWARKRQASTLHDCADVDDVASILRGIGLEALSQTIQIAATRDTELTSAAICSLLNNVSVDWFTSTHQLQDVPDAGSKPASAMSLPFIQPRSEKKNGSKHTASAANQSAGQSEPAASSEPDLAHDSLRMQSPRKFEPRCSLAQAMNAASCPKTTRSEDTDTSCERMGLEDISASANSANASQQRTPGMSLGAERERTSPAACDAAAFTSLSDLTASVFHECETPL